MSDKLRAAAKAALEWLRDRRLDTWVYMEGSQFYADRDKQAKALEAALAEPAIKESLTVQRPWVGLTDEEVNSIYETIEKVVGEHWENGGTKLMFPITLYEAFETKLREKNGG